MLPKRQNAPIGPETLQGIHFNRNIKTLVSTLDKAFYAPVEVRKPGFWEARQLGIAVIEKQASWDHL